MKYDVFISYSSLDQKVAEGVCAYLEQHCIRCFIAYRDIPKGVGWASAIVDALDESRMMIVVFSGNFNRSEQVDREIELASEDKKPILTFRISNDTFKGAKKYYLKNLNWIDAFPHPEQCFDSLCENVRKLLDFKDDNKLVLQKLQCINLDPIAPKEQYNLARRYHDGDGVPIDIEKAVYWYRKAAEQGYAEAQNSLGICYRNGDGVEYNSELGVYWYRKAANQGHADAQCNLGQCYYFGITVEKDEQQAVYWYRKAANQGHAFAQYNLGECYLYGDGVKKDEQQAVYWFRKAVEQGRANAQDRLGECYLYGLGVEKDEQQAVYWFRKAAAQGHLGVLYNLGECYLYGLGVEKDEQQALNFYRKAAQNGVPRAKKKLKELGETW